MERDDGETTWEKVEPVVRAVDSVKCRDYIYQVFISFSNLSLLALTKNSSMTWEIPFPTT